MSKGESLNDTAHTSRRWAPTRWSCATARPARRTGWPRRLDRRHGGQRRRRHPRAPHAGAARRVHVRRTLAGGTGDLTAGGSPIVGDVLHTRVARSNVLLLHTLGAEVTLVAPPTLLPVGLDGWPCAVSLRPRRGARRSPTSSCAAGAARADERRVLPQRARVQPALRPRRGAAGAEAGARDRDAPRTDEPRAGDRRRGRRLAPARRSSSRSPTACRVRMAVLYCCSAGRA